MTDRWPADLTLMRDLYARCDYDGATTMLPNITSGLAAAACGPDRARSLSLLHEAVTVASYLVHKLGYTADEWSAAERCREIAVAVGQPATIAHADFIRATAAIDCGSFERGLALAEHAADVLRPRLGEPDARSVRHAPARLRSREPHASPRRRS